MSGPAPVLLIGAGGLARETLAVLRSAGRTAAGLLDDDPAKHGREFDGAAVLGPIDAVADHPDAQVVICTASTRNQASRRQIAQRIALPPERYATVVHPAASLAPGTVVGEGSVFMAGVAVTAPQRIGAHVVAMPYTVFTHDDEVADYVTFASRATLSGSVRVGEAAYLGSGALVREGLQVGAGALIGMGAVVLRDVPDGEVWAGNPARCLRAAVPAGAA